MMDYLAASTTIAFILLLNSIIPCWSKYMEIDQNCKEGLTKLDSHMAAYVGTIYRMNVQHKNGDKYLYKVGVCIDVGGDNKTDCGIVQYGNNQSHCLGRVNSSQVARTKDGVWIELTYTNGDKYHNHCNKNQRIARIAFLCDPLVHGKGNLDFLEENNQDDLCYYMFSLAAKAVCGLPGNLTVGDIILIIGAVLLFLWLLAMIIGTLFKRFMMGAKGWEQVPLLDWYKAFGNLEADGCDLVCRTRSSKLVEYKEPSFGADTDEEDDEKDDNLLPM